MSKKVICHDIKGNKFEVDATQLIFRPSVYGILIEKGEVLLSKQWDGYDWPGGGVELDETMNEALRREFFEETGLEIKVGDVVHAESSYYVSNHSKARPTRFYNCQLLYFLVSRLGGELSIKNIDESEQEYIDMPRWIEAEKIGELKFYNSINNLEVFNKALKKIKK